MQTGRTWRRHGWPVIIATQLKTDGSRVFSGTCPAHASKQNSCRAAGFQPALPPHHTAAEVHLPLALRVLRRCESGVQCVETAAGIFFIARHRGEPGLHQFLKLLRGRVTLEPAATRSRLRRRATAFLRQRFQQSPPPRMSQRKVNLVRIQHRPRHDRCRCWRGSRRSIRHRRCGTCQSSGHSRRRLVRIRHAIDFASRRLPRQARTSVPSRRQLREPTRSVISPTPGLPALHRHPSEPEPASRPSKHEPFCAKTLSSTPKPTSFSAETGSRPEAPFFNRGRGVSGREEPFLNRTGRDCRSERPFFNRAEGHSQSEGSFLNSSVGASQSEESFFSQHKEIASRKDRSSINEGETACRKNHSSIEPREPPGRKSHSSTDPPESPWPKNHSSIGGEELDQHRIFAIRLPSGPTLT